MDLSALRYAVLGGDARQSRLFEILKREGLSADSLGLSGIEDSASFREIVGRADCLLLPLPATRDGVRLYREDPDAPGQIRMDSLAKCEKKIFFGGKLPDLFRKSAVANQNLVFDYFDSESLQALNALPTAEGAIFTAMRALPVTIEGTTFVVTGYGRIGRLLCERLVLLGAKVVVFERKRERHPFIRFSGARASDFFDDAENNLLASLPEDCRAVFNTVPEQIFTKEVLERFPKGALFIDLASPPGGLDPSAADEFGIKRIWATALPGKYAPESAASYLAETIFSRLKSLDR